MVDMNPGVQIAGPQAMPFHAQLVLSLVSPSVLGSGTRPRREKGGRRGARMSGQCVPFISVSPVASTVTGTE